MEIRLKKKTYSGLESLELAAYLAVVIYNDGAQGLREIIDDLNLDIDSNLESYLEDYTERRRKKTFSEAKNDCIDGEHDEEEEDSDSEQDYGPTVDRQSMTTPRTEKNVNVAPLRIEGACSNCMRDLLQSCQSRLFILNRIE